MEAKTQMSQSTVKRGMSDRAELRVFYCIDKTIQRKYNNSAVISGLIKNLLSCNG